MRACTKKPGFTIVELLMSLTITAMLLSAVGVAMQASLGSYQANEKIAAVTQTGRFAIDKMMADVRRADAVSTTSSRLTIIPPDDGSGLQQVQYEYVTGGTLYYRRTVTGSTSSYVLIGGDGEVAVSSLVFTSLMAQDDHGVWYTKNVTACMTLSLGGQPMVLSASASPRRSQTY